MHILPKLYIIFPVFFILIIEDIHTQNVSTFAEYGTTIHTGKHTPMWQNSNQHGLSSIKNNTYIRGAAFYNKNFHSWQLKAGADFAVAAGLLLHLLFNRHMPISDINGLVYGLEIKK